MSEVIITPSDLSEDAMVELTIPTSGKDNMKITMGEFIDEEIIEDEVPGAEAEVEKAPEEEKPKKKKIVRKKKEAVEDENKLLSVKLKVPDARPYSDYSSIYWKHNQILDKLKCPSYISTDLEVDKKIFTDHIEELYKYKLKTIEVLSRKDELSNLYSKICNRYKEPNSRKKNYPKGVTKDIITKRIFDYRHVRDEILLNMSRHCNTQKIEAAIRKRDNMIEQWKKELFNLELRYIKHNLESTHSDKMTSLERNINQECQKRQKEMKENRERDQMERESKIKARIDQGERKKQKQYDEWKKREDEIMAPDFKIQSREHIRILGDGCDDRLNGYNIFNNFRIGSEDFKYSDEFKKYLRENIDKYSKGKKEYEEYKLKVEKATIRQVGNNPQPSGTFASHREKDNEIKQTETLLNSYSKSLHILNAVKTFYDEEERIQKEKERQETKKKMELQKQEIHINKLKDEKKQVCINGYMFKRKKDETFDEFVHRINLKTPVSINKILGLEEGTLLDQEYIPLDRVPNSIFVPIDLMRRGGKVDLTIHSQ